MPALRPAIRRRADLPVLRHPRARGHPACGRPLVGVRHARAGRGVTTDSGGGTTASSAPSAAKTTLTVGLSYLPTDPDPAIGSDGTPAIVWRQVFDTLTTYTATSPNPVPALATSWQATDSARKWTFKIAAGKKFQDGSAVTAKAICIAARHQAGG